MARLELSRDTRESVFEISSEAGIVFVRYVLDFSPVKDQFEPHFLTHLEVYYYLLYSICPDTGQNWIVFWIWLNLVQSSESSTKFDMRTILVPDHVQERIGI